MHQENARLIIQNQELQVQLEAQIQINLGMRQQLYMQQGDTTANETGETHPQIPSDEEQSRSMRHVEAFYDEGQLKPFILQSPSKVMRPQ